MQPSDPGAELSIRHPTDFEEVRRVRRQREAEQLALVLAAVGIGCRLVAGRDGIGLYVHAQDAEAAWYELDAYERENRPAPPPPPATRTARHGLGAALACSAVLLFFFGAEQRHTWSIDWAAIGAAQAGLIQGGAWWRTVTALTLHTDHEHLLGNIAAGIAFGTLVAQLLGSGLAWLAILLAGALGNALNAMLQPPDHATVGASTALFGALGLAAGYMRQQRVVPWRGGIRRWAPLSAGILLLAFLGFGGERTDVGAHVAGFLVGGSMGLAAGRYGRHLPQGPHAQRLYALLACGLLALAWLLALRGPI